jgi:hypothetical protein
MPDQEPEAKSPAGQLAAGHAAAPVLPTATGTGGADEHEDAAVVASNLPVVAERGAGGIGEVVYAAARERALLMPDLRGRSLRDVARICERLGLELEARGEGRALRQSPEVGEAVAPRQTVRIEFGRGD